MSLLFVSQQLAIYIGFCLLVAGTLGNGINILIFATEKTYRSTPCTFYFLIGSIHNLIFILISLTTRILNTGFGIDFISVVNIWCKLRQYAITVLNMISITCSCLSTVDQFLVTSRRPFFRHLSQIKMAYPTVLIIIVVWILHGIPILVYQTVSPLTNSCTIINPNYATYASVYLIGFVCFIPISIMGTFSWLTHRNIQQINVLTEQRVDRQLIKMTFIQVLLVSISSLPYGIFFTYAIAPSNVNKDINRKLIEYLFSTLVSLIVDLFNTISCYMFLAVSGRFRQRVKNRLFCCQRHNRINPI